MEEINWTTVIEMMIPIAAVIIAGFFALKNSRKTVELEARNRWREDFRIHVSEYLEIFCRNIYRLIELRNAFKVQRFTPTEKETMILFASELTGSFCKIKLMLDLKDPYSNELMESYKTHELLLEKCMDGEKEIDIEIAIQAFSDISKRIYDQR